VSHRVLAGLLTLAAPLATAIPAGARPPLANTARLQGQFEMTGRITVAKRISGEHVGQTVARAWTFTPLCASGPCQTVSLTRQRQAGTDTVVLQLVSADSYSGKGRFYVPLRCGRRTIQRGESVPFKIRVQITGTARAGGVPVATELTASYVNRKRKNLTRCVTKPGHDAAVYTGTPAA
jgi:hypothetical protein